jgi:hypothetical protein
MKLLCYTAGPYRDRRGEWYVHQNIERAAAVALELWKMGFSTICPHKNTSFFGGFCPDATWLAGDLEMIRRCDLVVLLPGWENSEGSKAELAYAGRFAIPAYVWPRDREILAELAQEGTPRWQDPPPDDPAGG